MVSLISESTSSSVHHGFCCEAVMFWCVPTRLVSLIFHNCLHLLLNTGPLVEKILLHCLFSSPDPGHPGGDQWGRPLSPYPRCAAPHSRKVGNVVPPVCSSCAQASSSCLWPSTHHGHLQPHVAGHKLWIVARQYGLRLGKTNYSAEPQRRGWLSSDDI